MEKLLLAIAGGSVGSILTFILTAWHNQRRSAKERQYQVFLVLMGARGRIFSESVSDHINSIPVVFAKDASVRKAYQHFCATPEADSEEFFKRYIRMVIAIAKSCDPRADIAEDDIWHGFYPGPRQQVVAKTEALPTAS